jgi:outer membrane lipoprotein-sorting protein
MQSFFASAAAGLAAAAQSRRVSVGGRHSLRSLCGLLVFAVLAGSAGPACAVASDTGGTPLHQAQALLERMFTAAAAVQDYELVMDKQQRHDGRMQPVEELEIKHRRNPDCRYMRWVGKRNHGREMIYCPGRYGGKIEAHNGGLFHFITVGIDPDGERATKGQLHRIYDTGLFMLVKKVREDYDYLMAHPELPPPVLSHRDVHGQSSTCIDLAQGADLFKTYRVGRRELCIDDKLALPTELKLWNTDGDLTEHYVYFDYRLNPGLSDEDFDIHNAAYHF